MKFSFLFSTSLLVFASCNIMGERVEGNGNLASESRHVSNFKSIASSGPIDVVLTQSPTVAVQVSGDENLLSYITTETDGNTLKIKTKQGYNLNPKKHLQVRISAPDFEEISCLGSGNISSENTLVGDDKIECHLSGSGDINLKVDVPSIESHGSGSGDMTFSGKTQAADLSVTGSGDIHSYSLSTQTADINITGSSDVEVYATKQLNIKVTGSGDVHYKGGASVDSHITGSGSASKAD